MGDLFLLGVLITLHASTSTYMKSYYEDDYLKLLMQVYKTLHLNKAQGAIFGPEEIREKSGGKKNLDAMEIDKIQRKEGKSLQYC